MISIKQKVQEASEVVRKAWHAVDSTSDELPQAIIVTGSGLGSLVRLQEHTAFEIKYDDIPHVPSSGVAGHSGRLLIGHYTNEAHTKVVLLDGRVHGYEGHDPLTQVLPLLIANELCGGAKVAVLTNAAGAIDARFKVGSLMLISDHINFTGQQVVEFSAEADFGGSNMDMTFVYTPRYRSLLKATAQQAGIELNEGVYIGVKGAMFETPAEIQAFGSWGASAVGMSTVHEATAASRLGLEVVGVSVLTNMAAGIEAKKLTHAEVLEGTQQAADALKLLVDSALDSL